ncbi:FAD-dependent oxidoreductase [Brasilonema octagenarum]|uniref:FAD-binding monooxygenase n=1 Tax=Brasilonema octagenarum UFV-OR1 TaxID=417115 RepID=A0ABX1M225_9CYAN|nr:NAD(P)/FAD-dependent oxidoreductase [Brasilonema octagenarum]NMF61621.1 FAD-binding monooxygenase [Brasilonema octagenarum UFV-OR1]
MLTDTRAAEKTNHSRQNVLIVGGGPAGLATALMLAKRGWTNITVLEKRATADYYEPDKSFNYLIDGRGQKFTDFLGITDKLIEISVPSKEFYLTEIKANGSKKTFKLPFVDPKQKTAYWIPRRAFVLLLYQEIERNWQDKITVLFNTTCVEINKIAQENAEGEQLEVVSQTQNGRVAKFEPQLLVGCDGIYSIVRNTLKEWDKSTSDRFEMKCFPSPSSKLRYKVLSLPPNFPLDNSGEEHAVCTMSYAVRSAFRDSRRTLSLGLLPIKNPDEFRSANIIRLPNHEIWKLKNSEQVYNFLEQAFPQLPIHQIVSPEEAARFASSEGGYFPPPQYCSGLHFELRHKQVNQGMGDRSSTVGVVLLGDTIHCFPPDIGQGVNSALEDVCVLNEALSKNDDDISGALPLYESLRFADVKALIRLAQIAFPWQYNQAPLRTKLWNVNTLLRFLLNRLLPQIFSPPAFFLIRNYQLSYQEILVKAQRTTQILYILGLIVISGFLASVFRLVQI